MSLSQKHSGLILVPWFNVAEWNHVYSCVYSGIKEKQLDALKLLQIWKMRTPILPAGVEGTLILLEALLLDEEELKIEKNSQLYSVALMRFLNLSAANSDKQGSFMRTSTKNDLPKWLINLRHDIAHGHQIPSKFNLKMGLSFGFNWLKEKYWLAQKENLLDCYGETIYLAKDTIATNLRDYIYLNVALFEKKKLDEKYFQNIMDKINKKCQSKITDSLQIFDILEETIKQGLELDQSRQNIDELFNILLCPNAILKTNITKDIETEITLMNKGFRDIWKNILNVMHHYNLLSNMMIKLFDIMSNVAHFENTKLMAALWINELLNSLHRLKRLELASENEEDYLEIHSNNYLYITELLEFQNKVLWHSNKHSTHFLDNLLKYNENTEDFKVHAVTLINTKHNVENLGHVEHKIFTLSDLGIDSTLFEDEEMPESYDNVKDSKPSYNNPKKEVVTGSKWKKIEDTSIYKNCPIGVLPHQLTMPHPFLCCM